jgi:hypothetical protein
MSERPSPRHPKPESHHLTQDQVPGRTSIMLRIFMLRIIMLLSSAADNYVVHRDNSSVFKV